MSSLLEFKHEAFFFLLLEGKVVGETKRYGAAIVPSRVNFGYVLPCMVGKTVNEISLWAHLNHFNWLCTDHKVSAFWEKKKKKKAEREGTGPCYTVLLSGRNLWQFIWLKFNHVQNDVDINGRLLQKSKNSINTKWIKQKRDDLMVHVGVTKKSGCCSFALRQWWIAFCVRVWLTVHDRFNKHRFIVEKWFCHRGVSTRGNSAATAGVYLRVASCVPAAPPKMLQFRSRCKWTELKNLMP